MNISLIGNPNSGKTSLFNLLTGSNQKVGNLPGVTIEKKEGVFTSGDFKADIIDLPGIYSLEPDTAEQRVTKKYLSENKSDLIINIVDSTNLGRSLYLTLQLRAFNLPVIVLLNMTDEADRKNIEIDTEKLSRFLNMPVIKTSTYKRSGIEEVIKKILEIDNNGLVVTPACSSCDGCSNCSESSKLYKEIDMIESVCVKYPDKETKNDLTHYIDKVVLHKYFGLPIFLLIMLLIFSATFSGPALYLSNLIHYFLTVTLSGGVQSFFAFIGAPAFLTALLCNGVIPGIGSVLTFLPQISLLFIFLSILEDSGYMTRAALVADKLLAFTGLSGSSFIPMIMGFGCSVPAIMSCRILPSKKDRIITIMIVPFIACGARFPIIALFAGTFFKTNQGLFVFLMYILGVLVAFFAAFILNRTAFKSETSSFIMEMPPYRLPVFRNLFIHTWDKVKGFLIKAGTTLFAASIIIWFLSHYSISLSPINDMKNSILALISNVIAPLFIPLGFGTWRAASSLLVGVGSKEMIVSTLSVLYPASSGGLAASFSLAASISFVAFSLLYLPCISTIITMRRELKSVKLTALSLSFSFVSAYIISLIVYYISLGVLK
jgi:ferrous iron transport protein B